MTTQADALETTPRPAPVTWRTLAADFGRLLARAFVLALAVGLLLTAATIALPAPVEPPAANGPPAAFEPARATSGCFLMRRDQDQEWTAAPMLETDVRIRVSGLVARASVRQRFRNATDEWVEGVYVFPLPEQAAVDHLRMKVGERTIEGQIREREQARADYRQAKAEGRKASLVEQERPNVFTTSVANLGPGEELSVEIELQEALSFDEGEVRLRFPLVVAPRYVPGSSALAGLTGAGWSADTDVVPDASRITPPVLPPWETPRNPVAIELELDAGFPVATLRSGYHPVVTEARGEGRYRVRLRDALVPADRDFELAWTPQPGTLPRSAVFTEERGGSTYALVTLFPPVGPAVSAARLPREVVFVIDSSGSMEGPSIQQARRALSLAIDRLHSGDRFNVVRFSDNLQTLFPAARPVTAETQAEAHGFVEGLRACGGTQMRPALEAALVRSDDPRLLRQVLFLTDGAVGNEDELFGVIRERLGDTRLFTVAIGSAPNGHFMTKAAELGRGTFTYVGDVREVEEKMSRLFAALDSPVLTGIEVSWPVGAAVEAWPQRVPDLYLGEPVVVCARLEGKAEGIVVRGRRGGEPWETILPLSHTRASDGVAVVWARRKVQALVDSLLDGGNSEEVREQVVAVGLEHHLVTKHTSLVAVDVTPARPASAALQTTAVPTNLPHGWSYEAVFGELPRSASPAPQHALLALLSLALALVLLYADRSRRARVRW